MKTNAVMFTIFGAAPLVNAVCGEFTREYEIKQDTTYQVVDGIATVTAVKGKLTAGINLPLPLVFPVNDLGSGVIQAIEFNVDTWTVNPVTCPNESWGNLRILQQHMPSVQQSLMADFVGLL